MTGIRKEITVSANLNSAFDHFINDLNEWWPKEYTYAQNTLKEIRIDRKNGGLCTEIGPHGFRVDWGRVTELINNERVVIQWQISPNREPVPDPEMASEIDVRFQRVDDLKTKIVLEHSGFVKHGKGAEEYKEMMESEQGWEYILNCYKNYCDKQVFH